MIRILNIAAIAIILSSCGNGSRELVLAKPEGEVDREIAANLVDLLGNEAAVDITLTKDSMTGGQALEAIVEGRADIALISNDQPFREDIATVMPMYATVLHIVYPADRTAANVAQLLQNATVFAGDDGSASRRVFERLTANTDLGDAGYRFVTDRSVKVDLAVVFAPIAPDRLAEYPGVRLWTMGSPDDIGAGGPVDAAVLLNPHFRPFIIPAGTYGDAANEAIVTIAVDKLVVARKELDPSVVYDFINEILRLRPALAAKHPGVFQHLSDDFDASRSRFILHTGTQDYLQRSEPTFVERYSGVAEVLVTLMIAAFSASFAGVRIYNRRRKNRIDRFYAAALNIRNSIDKLASDSARRTAINELRKLQDEAFELLVAEKLAADESFRIFITLSNDIVEQIDGLQVAGNGD
jgi:TRAP-type uncharacterized transport system substrate-binding protein